MIGIGIGINTPTFNSSTNEYPLEVIDCPKKHLDVEDELFGHADGVEVGAIAGLVEHVGYACRGGFFERGEDA